MHNIEGRLCLIQDESINFSDIWEHYGTRTCLKLNSKGRGKFYITCGSIDHYIENGLIPVDVEAIRIGESANGMKYYTEVKNVVGYNRLSISVLDRTYFDVLSGK